MPQEASFLTSRLGDAIGWARKYSIFQYPFVTACCGMEYMATACSHYDVDRFGAGFPRFSPRQADVLFVVGTISHKMAPVLRRIYDQMAEPKWVLAMGVCASSGGMFNNYAIVQGVDHVVPVDMYLPGCPPRPEMLIDAILKLHDQVQATKLGANRAAQIEELENVSVLDDERGLDDQLSTVDRPLASDFVTLEFERTPTSRVSKDKQELVETAEQPAVDREHPPGDR